MGQLLCGLTDAMQTELAQWLETHAAKVIHHEAFFSSSEAAVKLIISRDSFCAAEVDIFKAVDGWSKAIGKILNKIRLELDSIPDLLKVVKTSELIPAYILLDAI